MVIGHQNTRLILSNIRVVRFGSHWSAQSKPARFTLLTSNASSLPLVFKQKPSPIATQSSQITAGWLEMAQSISVWAEDTIGWWMKLAEDHLRILKSKIACFVEFEYFMSINNWNIQSSFHNNQIQTLYVVSSPCMHMVINPDSKVHGANKGPTWVLSAPGGPHVGPHESCYQGSWHATVL